MISGKPKKETPTVCNTPSQRENDENRINSQRLTQRSKRYEKY